MRHRKERETFQTTQQVIEAVRDICTAIASRLSRWQQCSGDAGERLLLAKVEEQQDSLRRMLVGYLNDASREVLETHVQNPIAIDPTRFGDSAIGDESDTTTNVCHVLEWNGVIENYFAALAAQTTIPGVSEAYDGLARAVHEKTKQMARTMDEARTL